MMLVRIELTFHPSDSLLLVVLLIYHHQRMYDNSTIFTNECPVHNDFVHSLVQNNSSISSTQQICPLVLTGILPYLQNFFGITPHSNPTDFWLWYSVINSTSFQHSFFQSSNIYFFDDKDINISFPLVSTPNNLLDTPYASMATAQITSHDTVNYP
jgi:hypothetical protein